jgi:A/G-specific adenine glycosylase
VFPDTETELRKLPGIGPYTAAAIAAIAFDQPETVVDGNVERVMSRVFAVTTPLPDAKKELTAIAANLTPANRPGDYAQAVMDLGATVCTPRNPTCDLCPWQSDCLARSDGIQAKLPRKRPKAAKPTRRGFVYLARRDDGAWLLERRPDKGLLGGMLGWPTSEWTEEPQESPPLSVDWTHLDAEVRHTFTHFHLRLALRTAKVGVGAANRGEFQSAAAFRPGSLPTAMRKAYDLAKPWFDAN